MRVNLPVTQHEYLLRDDDLIVSRTDLKGRITYVNPVFLRTSGFEMEELLGKAHNVVRHPDMPPEAYSDMWTDLQSGRPWSGMVKNRCKNGDFYWVRANVTPIRENGSVSGYMSVRTKPTREEIAGAEQAYRQLRESPQRGLMIEHGKAVHRGMMHGLRGLLRLPATLRIGLHTGGGMAFMALLALAPVLDAPRAVGIALAALGVAWLAGGWLWLQHTWLRPLLAARESAEIAASGDLVTAHFDESTDPEVSDVMRAIEQMKVNLRAVINDVRQSVGQVRGSVERIAQGNGQLADRTQSQSAALEQSSASLEELSATVRQSADHARDASSAANDASSRMAAGTEAVRRVVSTMDSIGSSSSRIRSIVGVIDTIAFQTNILALNAAVEAARAGDQGRGFAVVASEVRSLAQRAGSAAGEIRQLIDESLQRINEGQQAVIDANGTISGIEQHVNRVSELVREISQSAREQDQGLAQINEAVASLDNVTQENSSMVDATADYARRLEQEAAGLSDTVSTFRVT
jgi:aerotaxis receptor